MNASQHSKTTANRIDFPSISAKLKKAASKKGHMKLLLLEVYTKIKGKTFSTFFQCKPLDTIM